MTQDTKIEDNVTFGGQEAVPLKMEDILHAVDLLKNKVPTDTEIARITHNCDDQEFDKEFGVVRETSDEAYAVKYYGLPVYRRGWVPYGEVWLQDVSGNILQKFNVTNPTTS